jgi:K+-transporting ATPase ATPase C chain
MIGHLRANVLLVGLTLLIGSIVYPGLLWLIGQAAFYEQANGSLLFDRAGEVTGSRLIAQPFTGDEYFQPRPSAAGYNAAASGASNWSASNYQLRFRVAKVLGPIVKYGKTDGKKGQLAGPDIEKWFQTHPAKDGKGIVAQWAQGWPSAAATWVKDDKANSAYVEAWQKSHPREVAQWTKENPNTPEPKPENLAIAFFVSYSVEHPGTFPSLTERKLPDTKTEKAMQPVKEGTDIQSYFFDMWRQENPDIDLEEVPADRVMASGSGLDPHITLENALYQLDRVASKWAETSKRGKSQVTKEIEELLRQKAEAPFGGLVGVDLVNVLELNLALKERYGAPPKANK